MGFSLPQPGKKPGHLLSCFTTIIRPHLNAKVAGSVVFHVPRTVTSENKSYLPRNLEPGVQARGADVVGQRAGGCRQRILEDFITAPLFSRVQESSGGIKDLDRVLSNFRIPGKC